MYFDFKTFDPNKGLVLDKETSSLCRMEVRENADLRWMMSEDGVLHGAMSLKEPCVPLVPYVRSMLIAHILKPEATKVLNLGLGTGAIERYIGEVFPQVKLTTVEMSQTRLEQVKRFFHLCPSSSSLIVVQDASKFISRKIPEQDIIYCDLFDVRSNYNEVLSNDFITNLWEALSKNGLIAINYVLENQKKLINTLIILRKIFAVTAIIKVEGHTNIVILAFKTDKSDGESIILNINKFDDAYDLNFANVLQSIEWLPHPHST
tara:strand:- start:239 stop:1027 length:789 start_codon:yes stop_codon:yes gene_type:complete